MANYRLTGFLKLGSCLRVFTVYLTRNWHRPRSVKLSDRDEDGKCEN